MTQDARNDVQQQIRELTQPTSHTEQIRQPEHLTDGTIAWTTTTHQTVAPALIDQLQACESANGSQGGTQAGFASQPVANIGAIDALTRIDLAAARWVRELGEDDPGDTKACVLKLNGLRVSAHRCDGKRVTEWLTDDYGQKELRATCCTQHDIEVCIATWWTLARCLTGWDEAPWKPDNTCPRCNERRSLRIRLYDQLATCTDCRSTWGPDEIGLLAEHIREENNDNDAPEGDAA